MSKVREELSLYLDEAPWELLDPHARKQSLFLVAPMLDLLDVGEALALNDTAKVSGWIEAGQLSRPSLQQLEAWNRHPQLRFQVIIVRPFVLVSGPLETLARTDA